MATAARFSRIAVGGTRASAWLKSFSTGTASKEIDTTIIEDEFDTYIKGGRSWNATGEGLFDTAQFEVMKDEFYTEAHTPVLFAPLGWVAGVACSFGMASQTELKVSTKREDAVALSFAVTGNEDLYNGISLASGGSSASESFVTHDNLVTKSGAAFQVHVYSNMADDDFDFILEHSADGVAWSTLATVTIPAATVAAELVVVAGTVERYMRLSTLTAATVGAVSFVAAAAVGI